MTLVRLTPARPDRPLLVVGPSLGTATSTLWGACAELLAGEFEIVGWELPGHGEAPPATGMFRVEDLAQAVFAAVDEHLPDRRQEALCYAGDSIGGAVGLALLVHHPQRVAAATLACTGARIGTPAGWKERAATVRAEGTDALVAGSAKRWFGPGFIEREADAAGRLLDGLRHVDAESYARVCEALGVFDIRADLGRIRPPLTLVAGEEDEATPTTGLEEIAQAVAGARLVKLAGVAHLAPIEAPEAMANAIRLSSAPSTVPSPTPQVRRLAEGERTAAEALSAGMGVRREVLGDAWVDKAIANTTDFTRDFQWFITQYAWGTVWTRPGLDRRSRSMVTITALVAQGHHQELALHIRGAIANGLTRDEIKEVLIHAAVYCGVPAANAAFRVAQAVFDELED